MSIFEQEAANFLSEHTIATLSTVSNDGTVSGAVIYYTSQGEGEYIYFVSKTATTKVKNILQHPQVALTIFDAAKAQTLQIHGDASEETDESTQDWVFADLVKPRPYSGAMLLPPVTALKDGSFTVIVIRTISAHFSDYKKELEEHQSK